MAFAMIKTRVLVVEAEADVSEQLEGCLRRLGYEVTGVVNSGEAAISAARSTRPDVVLLDITLDGLGRSTDPATVIQRRLHLPVIYLSGNSTDTTVSRVRATGPFGFVHAPFIGRELQVAIEMALFRHRLETEKEELIAQLQTALAQVKALSGLLPICAQCKKVRDDGGYWSQVEAYIEQRTEARFSHGLCPICFDAAMARHRDEIRTRTKRRKKKDNSRPARLTARRQTASAGAEPAGLALQAA